MAGVGKRVFGRWCACVSRGRCGTSDALTRSAAVDGGSAWQVWGNVHLDVAARAFHVAWWGKVATGGVANVDSRGRRGEACTQRAFRVAGVGNGAIDGLAGYRFAWQAQGIVHPS